MIAISQAVISYENSNEQHACCSGGQAVGPKGGRQRCRTELLDEADALTAVAELLFGHMKHVGFTLETVEYTRSA
jgi:hypothetical protein